MTTPSLTKSEWGFLLHLPGNAQQPLFPPNLLIDPDFWKIATCLLLPVVRSKMICHAPPIGSRKQRVHQGSPMALATINRWPRTMHQITEDCDDEQDSACS
eukprot:gnl/MRDRNA2_/MRDRNA2_84016_c0_seq1.p1 gnl/MRDRNA2_/MRDRNA2_84016_c0~~gnl/MRDRNA2_/MRDRNA2_84016_c0_seq1.p1  ORF type:complete len:101 (+),score=11.37 gnl/MRDRNA2_/MRDRNA2_84016_c0_seq1:407-709(+)